MTLFFASVALALLVSFLCSILEAAVLSLTPTQIAQLSSRHPQAGMIWQDFKANINRPIAVILILNTAAHTIGATIAGSQFEVQYGSQGLFWFSLLFTYLMLQFTEILPKTLGVQFNTILAPVIAVPLTWLIRIMSPVVWFIHLINRPFESRTSQRMNVTLEEITALAGLARLSNLLSPHQEKIIQSTSQLSLKKVRDIMIPLEQVTLLSTSQELMDAVVTAHMDPHTRFPICENNDRQRILGYINFKEMIYRMRMNPNATGLRGIIRPVHYVNGDQSATELLRVFVERHEHMAIVQDSEGKTLGLVTLEDVIEELVGELEDEFDRLPRMLHPLEGGIWMVGGGVPVTVLATQLGLTLSDLQGSTSAWLLRRFARIPKPNEIYREAGAEFMVRRTRRGKIFEVSVSLPQPSASVDR